MPTRLASSTLVIRPSAWISPRILRSISSRFFGTRVKILGWQRLAGNIGNSLSAAGQRYAILLRVRCANYPLAGKICRYGLQFLHGLPDILDLDLTLSAPSRCPAGHIPPKR